MTLDVTSATLYDFPFSSSSYRLRIAMGLKGVTPAQVVTIKLREGEHLAEDFVRIAGAPLLPAVDFGVAGFGQSIALIEWLDTAYPTPRLIPKDSTQALEVRALALGIACDIHPLNTPRILKYLGKEMGQSEGARQKWYNTWVRDGFTVLERQLAAYADRGPFCVGDAPTLADICLIPQVLNARRFGVPVDDFDRINAIYTHCQTLAAFKNAAPQTD